MMFNDPIGLAAQRLAQRFGAEIPTGFYSHVRTWLDWWRGYYKPFHTYQELGADNAPRQRKLFKMDMAKRVCEDWAAILLNDKTEITVSHPGSSAFLMGAPGEKGLGGVLGQNNFWPQANRLLERAFACGTGAFVLRVQGLSVDKNGRVRPDMRCRIGIEYLDAMGIIPLSIKNGRITECAFISEFTRLGKPMLYLETHTKDKNGNYVIENELFSVNGGTLQPEALPQGMAKRLDTGSRRPWFALIYPNQTVSVDGANGLGQSVYAGAIDNLMGVDLAFNNFLRDLKLGGKKVFVSRKMTCAGEGGVLVTPDDVAQSLFQMVGDELDFDAKQLIQEYNPKLRVEENKAALQSQLDYLSFKCGLGTHRYKLTDGSVRTATEFTGERQELVQYAMRHMIVIENALVELCRGILYIGREFCGADADPEAEIAVRFEDSFIISEEDSAKRDLGLVEAGIMPPWEYRVRHMGESASTAQRMCAGAAV